MVMIDTTFFCGLDQILLPVTTFNGEKFSNSYYITRDKGKILNLISGYMGAIGSVEADYLMHSAKAVVYRSGKVNSTGASEKHVSEALATQLIEDMKAVRSLDSALWLIKDNACHFDRAWIVGTLGGLTAVNTNFWASRHSCADGTFREVSFSSDELRVACGSRRPTGIHLDGTGAPTTLAKGSLRFQRFEYFVAAARADLDVAMKIALYCSGLEALVSTSQQELSHQVSERVAAVLVGPGPKRISIFKLVKKAYGFRSKTVHGASFKLAEVNQLRSCSADIDNICRFLQILYLSADPSFQAAVERSDESLSEFFVEAVLGAREAQACLEIEVSP